MVHNSVNTLISIHFVTQSEGFFKNVNRHRRFRISYCVFRIFSALHNVFDTATQQAATRKILEFSE